MRPLLAILVPSLMLALASGVEAAPQPVPPSAYPSGAILHPHLHVSNQQVDANWGFDAQGDPLYHSRTQDDLHRVGGLAQYAESRHRHAGCFFVLWANRYTGVDRQSGQPNAQAAFVDFIHTSPVLAFSLLPSPDATHIAVLSATDSLIATYAVAIWQGNVEVEATVSYPPTFKGYVRTLRADVMKEAQAALQIENQSA